MRMREGTGSDWADEARAATTATVARLAAAEAGAEQLAEFVPAGRRFRVFPRPATMLPQGEVWRLGVLLLARSGDLFALGQLTRAAERGRVGYQSSSREERRDLAAAALRGGYPVGTPVNFNATPLPFDEARLAELGGACPLGIADGSLRVRWRAGASLAGAPTLARYLAERADLLLDPPFAADERLSRNP